MGKRLFDLVAASVAILLLLPIFAVVALAISIESGLPVLFSQTRIGLDLRQFQILKFRTMVVEAPHAGLAITVEGDSRITRVGRWLRATKLDELPQLINVFRGDMSIVGPRPEVPRYVESNKAVFAKILQIRPGLTDFASIKYRNESDILAAQPDPEKYYREVILPDKLELAKEYIQCRSAAVDFAIILRTLKSLAQRQRKQRTPA